MREAGMTWDEIEQRIAEIPDSHPLRQHFVDQYLSLLPADLRDAATARLLSRPS